MFLMPEFRHLSSKLTSVSCKKWPLWQKTETITYDFLPNMAIAYSRHVTVLSALDALMFSMFFSTLLLKPTQTRTDITTSVCLT